MPRFLTLFFFPFLGGGGGSLGKKSSKKEVEEQKAGIDDDIAKKPLCGINPNGMIGALNIICFLDFHFLLF